MPLRMPIHMSMCTSMCVTMRLRVFSDWDKKRPLQCAGDQSDTCSLDQRERLTYYGRNPKARSSNATQDEVGRCRCLEANGLPRIKRNGKEFVLMNGASHERSSYKRAGCVVRMSYFSMTDPSKYCTLSYCCFTCFYFTGDSK